MAESPALTGFIDPAQLIHVQNLELLARIVVRGLQAGIHKGVNTGASIEFAQYRPYAQGDDPRMLDWKLYGRTDRLHVKQYQEETGLHCTILLDCSASMAFGSGQVSKFHFSRMLAASLITLLQSQRDAVGLLAYHRELLIHHPPSMDHRRTRQLFVDLAHLQAEESTDTPAVLRFLGDVIKPRGMVVLISDLLHPLDQVIEHLKSIRSRRHDVLVLQIADPAERDFSFDFAVTLIDAESEREEFVVPDAVREGYLENRRRHFAQIQSEAAASEIDLAEFTTDRPLDYALRHFLHHRNRALLTSGRR